MWRRWWNRRGNAVTILWFEHLISLEKILPRQPVDEIDFEGRRHSFVSSLNNIIVHVYGDLEFLTLPTTRWMEVGSCVLRAIFAVQISMNFSDNSDKAVFFSQRILLSGSTENLSAIRLEALNFTSGSFACILAQTSQWISRASVSVAVKGVVCLRSSWGETTRWLC